MQKVNLIFQLETPTAKQVVKFMNAFGYNDLKSILMNESIEIIYPDDVEITEGKIELLQNTIREGYASQGFEVLKFISYTVEKKKE